MISGAQDNSRVGSIIPLVGNLFPSNPAKPVRRRMKNEGDVSAMKNVCHLYEWSL
jgi:hypothetical protein